MNPNQQSDEVSVNNPLKSMQSGERDIFEVKRHPIGMLGIYIVTGIILVALAVVAFGVAPAVLTSMDKNQVITYGALVFMVVALIMLGFVAVSHIVYWGNRWILTSDSLTQVSKRSLFDKQSSQLSLGNLEDVTAAQDGILAHMFNFGVLKVETAGEHSKFVFPFCPNPNYYAQQILSAREQFEQKIESNEGGGKAYPTGVNTNAAPTGTFSYQVPTDDDIKT